MENNNKHTPWIGPLLKTAGPDRQNARLTIWIDRIIYDIQKLFLSSDWEKLLFHSTGRRRKDERFIFFFLFCLFFFLNWISKPSAGRTFVNGQLVNLSEEDKEGGGGALDETHFVLRKGQICIDDASFSILHFFCGPLTGNDYKRSKGRSAPPTPLLIRI